jgi:hypothetical protein
LGKKQRRALGHDNERVNIGLFLLVDIHYFVEGIDEKNFS